MGADKSELKALIADGFAAEFLDSREKAHRSVALHKGAAEGLAKAKEVINGVTQQVRNELVENGIPFDPNDPIEVGKFVVAQLMAAVRKVHELSENAALSSIRAEGALHAYETIVNRLAEAASQERAKAEGIRQAMAAAAGNNGNGDVMLTQTEMAHVTTRPGARVPGTHPGMPMKAQRQAEAAAESPAGAQAQAPAKENPATGRPRRKAAKAKKKAADATDT
jgi:hypothetical protein